MVALENLGLHKWTFKRNNWVSRLSLGLKTNQKTFDKRECEEFGMALQHKSKLRVYKDLKREVGFEEYLEYVKETPSRWFSKFCLGTH